MEQAYNAVEHYKRRDMEQILYTDFSIPVS